MPASGICLSSLVLIVQRCFLQAIHPLMGWLLPSLLGHWWATVRHLCVPMPWGFPPSRRVSWAVRGEMCYPNTQSGRRQWQPTPVLLPGKSHGRRSLVGCSPWGRWGSDTTERLRFYFSLSCFREGNGNPLHCSCLENLRDGGACWAAIYGVTQSRTRLKWLSNSSNTQSRVN